MKIGLPENIKASATDILERRVEPYIQLVSQHIREQSQNNRWLKLLYQRDEGFGESSPQERRVARNARVIELYDSISTRVGYEQTCGESMIVDQRTINAFAEVTGDHQWIHCEPERAAKHPLFKGTVAHGFLVLSLIPSLTEKDQEKLYPNAKMVVNAGIHNARFLHPVRCGARVRARSMIVEIALQKRCVELVKNVKIELTDSERIVCTADVLIKVYT